VERQTPYSDVGFSGTGTLNSLGLNHSISFTTGSYTAYACFNSGYCTPTLGPGSKTVFTQVAEVVTVHNG
jgi:hypothetical protein